MITMNDIIREGHPVLREKAKDVALPLNEEDKKIAESLLEYVKNSQDPEVSQKYGLRPGVGLAAPQIAVSKRMIAVHVYDERGQLFSYVLINPKIVSHSVEQAYLASGEGCLSVDREVPGYVHRYARVTVKASDLEGNEFKIRLKGMPAIVVQHEIDHLNGVMFYDHIDPQNPFAVPQNSTPIER
ncbi:peptide deformylase [Bacillus thermotolerans]|uniref:Peptide deformylase n=1 Tax=Bacillus thermotolerans TaxID=1221996 RepID=A0A0F5IAP3_BACTR|nr:peptide deformylase [Bacillus thermotolerans]KKB41948.1 Peptide deformylase [Bacillus thermotolerans]KKB42581.1 Peptide deformylase [Bacillus thermotolerans]